jgi:methylated-DNA-protein-cysteine methyltransferase related protein
VSEREWLAIVRVVESIPPGKVASYGQVAALAGLPRRARLVGRVLAHLPPDSGVPWHRVINARGGISVDAETAERQRSLLAGEGVEFRASGLVDLRRFGIAGDGRCL